MLNDQSLKLHLVFLSYILNIINTVNLEMQSEQPRMHVFLPRLIFLFRQVARNFIKKPYLDSKKSIVDINLDDDINYTENELIYCGADFDIMSKDTEDKILINSLRIRFRNFHQNLFYLENPIALLI